ncbi:MAG: hypothetical protein IPL59_14275 [Candidatus Competibacteraceae bacterium]|nr:hypothetical protein [Candidatus Competibacteraceae bacterium]
MILIALANRLRAGVVQGYFSADPMVQRVLPLLGAEHFLTDVLHLKMIDLADFLS